MGSHGIAVLLVGVLASACATSPRVRLDTGQGAPREYRPPTMGRSVAVGDAEFESALTRLLLDSPLPVRPVQQAQVVRTSYPGSDAGPWWRHFTSKNLESLCKPGQRRADCLSLLDDVAGFSQRDKLGVAFALSLEPLRQSIAKAVEDTLAPQLFYTVIASGLISWAVLAANPEPVFTKAAAIVSVLMLIYLGVETFLELVASSRELKQATDRATTWEELEQAGQRFALRVGPEVARVFVLIVTVVVSHGMNGANSLLASRLSTLPGSLEAAAAGAWQLGIRVASVGEVSAVVISAEGLITLVLAPTAVAMSAGPSGPVGGASQGALEIAQSGGRHAGFLKNYEGKPPDELRRGIDSLKKQIVEHQDKIAHPEKYISDWQSLDPRQQQALINKKWPADIQRQAEQLEILEGLLKKALGSGST